MKALVLPILTLCLIGLHAGAAASGEPQPALELLLSKSFDDKAQAVTLLGEAADDTAETLLAALVDSRLFYVKKDKRIVTVEKKGSKYQLSDALSGQDLGLSSKRKVKKISINNKLRKQIRQTISRMKLTDADAAAREAWPDVAGLVLRSLDPSQRATLSAEHP